MRRMDEALRNWRQRRLCGRVSGEEVTAELGGSHGWLNPGSPVMGESNWAVVISPDCF